MNKKGLIRFVFLIFIFVVTQSFSLHETNSFDETLTLSSNSMIALRKDSKTKKNISSNRKKNNQKRTKTKNKTVKKTPLDYKFGQRIIKHGDIGNDVRCLAVLLVNHLYMNECDIVYVDTFVAYEGKMIEAVKRVQTEYEIEASGIIDSLTYGALKNISRNGKMAE